MAIPGTYHYPNSTSPGGTPAPAPTPTPTPTPTPAPLPGRGGWLDWLRQLIEGSQTGGAFNWDTFLSKLHEGRPGAGVGGWPTSEGSDSEDSRPSTGGGGGTETAGHFNPPTVRVKDMGAILAANPAYLRQYDYAWGGGNGGPRQSLGIVPWVEKPRTPASTGTTGSGGGSGYFGGGGGTAGGTASGSSGSTGGGFSGGGGWASFLSSLFGR